MTEAFRTLYIASSAFNGPLSRSAVQENSYVPQDFALSFDIKLSETVLSMASIIHFVGSASLDFLDLGSLGRMPGSSLKLGLSGRIPGMIFTNVTD